MTAIGGAVAVGGAFVGTAAADAFTETPDGFVLYAIDHGSNKDDQDYLIAIDPTDGTVVEEIPLTLNGSDATNMKVATLAIAPRASPDDPVVVYGINRRGNRLFYIDTSDGVVEQYSPKLSGSDVDDVTWVWASTFTRDGTWWGISKETKNVYHLRTPDQADPTPWLTQVGNLGAGALDVTEAVNIGLTVDEDDTLWGVFDLVSDNNNNSEVFTLVETGGVWAAEVVYGDVLTSGPLVGVAYNPCTDTIFVAREGDQLFAVDLADGAEEGPVGIVGASYATGGRGIKIDNLAMTLESECTTVEERCEYPLSAGQHIPVGSLFVSREGDTLTVTYETTDGWAMTETHLQVVADPADFAARNGNPVPGQFPYSTNHDPTVTEYTYEVDVSGLTTDDSNTLYIAAHAVVVNGEREETAWSGCAAFDGRNWATYSVYSDEACGCPETDDQPTLDGAESTIESGSESEPQGRALGKTTAPGQVKDDDTPATGKAKGKNR